jgi:hypothetical protein
MDSKTNTEEHIVNDPQMRAVKDKMMARLRKNSMLNSVSTIGALIGGPLFAAGIMGVASTLFGKAVVATAGTGAVAVAEGAAATGGAAVATGIAAIGGWPVIAMLAVGALFVGISVMATYKASRIWQSKQFDAYEVSAQSTAHHLVQELKGNNMCLVEEHKRADGKSWGDYLKERAAAAEQSQQIH